MRTAVVLSIASIYHAPQSIVDPMSPISMEGLSLNHFYTNGVWG